MGKQRDEFPDLFPQEPPRWPRPTYGDLTAGFCLGLIVAALVFFGPLLFQ